MGNRYSVANHSLALKLSLPEADTFSTFTFSYAIVSFFIIFTVYCLSAP